MEEQRDLEFQKLLSSRKRHRTEEEKRRIVEDYLSKRYSREQLCEIYGVGQTTVYKWISTFAPQTLNAVERLSAVPVQ